MKKYILPVLCTSLLMLTACGSASTTATKSTASTDTQKKTVKIGITQIVEHPSLDAARQGFLAALKDGGYKKGENLQVDSQNAHGDMNSNMTIAQKLTNEKDDLNHT